MDFTKLIQEAKIMSPENNSTNNFGDIALCLSGGGYRAAAFHLGTLRMLNKVGLLENVTLLSTVSGGTIVGSSYAGWRIHEEGNDNRDFEVFFDEFRSFLQKTNVIEQALEKLAQRNDSNQKDKFSLICEAANVYTKLPYSNVTFGDFFDGKTVKNPFKEIFFNTTEFKTGLSFRFSASKNKKRTIGSTNDFSIEKEKAKKIRLADIIAASSCFPAGFEPIVFPDDFAGMKEEMGDYESFSLMDGGIFDNQGIDSLLLLNENEREEVDFYVISDTTQRNDELLKSRLKFDFADNVKANAFRFISDRADTSLADSLVNLQEILVCIGIGVCLAILVYLVILAFFVLSFLDQNGFNLANVIFGTVLIAIPTLVFAAVAFLTYSTKFTLESKFVKLLEKFEKFETNGFEFNLLPFLKKITLNNLANLLIRRLDSLVVMSSSVFMKRIRSLQQRYVNTRSQTRNKTAFNLIYDLNPDKNKSIWDDHPYLKPTTKMRKLCKQAEEMETTLWFGDENSNENNSNISDLDSLIECGEMSICSSLLTFLLEKRESYIECKYKVEFQKIKSEWDKLTEKYKDTL